MYGNQNIYDIINNNNECVFIEDIRILDYIIIEILYNIIVNNNGQKITK